MQHSGDLDRIYENAVNDDIGKWCKHQFPSSMDAAWTPMFRMVL